MRPNKPHAGKDELAGLVQNASALNPLKYMLRGGKEAVDWFLDAEKKGASKEDLYRESGEKFADPDTESGLWRGVDNNLRFQVTDKGMRVKPSVKFDPIRGGSTMWEPAGDTFEHDVLFDRMPELKNVQTRFIMPEAGNGMPGGGWYAARGTNEGGPTGRAEMRARSTERRPNSDMPFSLLDVGAHELAGHGVQDLNQFSKGDNEMNDAMVAAFSKHVHPRAKQYKDELSAFRDQQGMSEVDFAGEYPMADWYLDAASRLYKPAKVKKYSALPYGQRYENVAGEEEARRVASSRTMSAPELRDDLPWLSETPQELQLINELGRYRMKPDTGTLARLMQRKPL